METDAVGLLLGLGNPLLDISADVPTSMFESYAVTPGSAILAEDRHMPLYAELAENYKVQYIAGGAAQNTMRVAQWMIGQPGATSYFGCVGTDEFGDQLKRCATEDGVNVHYMEDPTTPTGVCAVLIDVSGERSLIANLSAANKFSSSHLETVVAKDIIRRAQFYYLAGFFLTVSPESVLQIARHAAEESKVLALNLAAPFVIENFYEQLHGAMPYVDFLFGNETEASVFGERRGWGSHIPTIALKLAAEPKASGTRPRIVVITQGAGSTILAHEGKAHEFAVEPLPKQLLVDTNGAGDACVRNRAGTRRSLERKPSLFPRAQVCRWLLVAARAERANCRVCSSRALRGARCHTEVRL